MYWIHNISQCPPSFNCVKWGGVKSLVYFGNITSVSTCHSWDHLAHSCLTVHRGLDIMLLNISFNGFSLMVFVQTRSSTCTTLFLQKYTENTSEKTLITVVYRCHYQNHPHPYSGLDSPWTMVRFWDTHCHISHFICLSPHTPSFPSVSPSAVPSSCRAPSQLGLVSPPDWEETGLGVWSQRQHITDLMADTSLSSLLIAGLMWELETIWRALIEVLIFTFTAHCDPYFESSVQ